MTASRWHRSGRAAIAMAGPKSLGLSRGSSQPSASKAPRCRDPLMAGSRPAMTSEGSESAQHFCVGNRPGNLSNGSGGARHSRSKWRMNMRCFILAAVLMPLAYAASAQTTTGTMAAPAPLSAGPAMGGAGTNWTVRPPDPNNCGTPDAPSPCSRRAVTSHPASHKHKTS